jgi:uncharacterized SAM-binding protein YcdF (DUF218 family)
MHHLPTTELVIRDGAPVWLVQGGGVSVAHGDRHTAAAQFARECQRRGLQLSGGSEQPRRGPSECDEPGV